MTVKNNVMGKKITRTYEINAKRDSDGRLEEKPKLSSNDNVEWENILSFDGTNIRANNYKNYAINIDGEEVTVSKEVFEAKSNEMILYTTKELEIIEPNKSESDRALEKLICEYNKQEIEKDEKLTSYCKLHNLLPDCTDVDELKKVVYEKEISVGGYMRIPMNFASEYITFRDNSQTIL